MWHSTDHTTCRTTIASQHENRNTRARSTSNKSGRKDWALGCRLRLPFIVIRQGLFTDHTTCRTTIASQHETEILVHGQPLTSQVVKTGLSIVV